MKILLQLITPTVVLFCGDFLGTSAEEASNCSCAPFHIYSISRPWFPISKLKHTGPIRFHLFLQFVMCSCFRRCPCLNPAVAAAAECFDDPFCCCCCCFFFFFFFFFFLGVVCLCRIELGFLSSCWSWLSCTRAKVKLHFWFTSHKNAGCMLGDLSYHRYYNCWHEVAISLHIHYCPLVI